MKQSKPITEEEHQQLLRMGLRESLLDPPHENYIWSKTSGRYGGWEVTVQRWHSLWVTRVSVRGIVVYRDGSLGQSPIDQTKQAFEVIKELRKVQLPADIV